MFLLISSENLRILVDFTVKAAIKRLDEATEALADFLNSYVLGSNGPDKRLAMYLCAPGHTGSLVANHIPREHAGHAGRIIPKNLNEAKQLPLFNAHTDLVLAFGCLRSFDYSANNTISSQPPQSNFSVPRGTVIMKGTKRLDKYGPLFYELLYCTASAIGGAFLKICAVSSAAQVEDVLGMYVSR